MAEPQGFTVQTRDSGYDVIVDSVELDGLEVAVHVDLPDHVETEEIQQRVVEEYAGNIETFIRKNIDYGSSFATGPKIESLLKYGEVRDGEIPKLAAKQIFVRGFLDKLSRFYSLYLEDNEATVDESVMDTLLDLGNYSHMLAAIIRREEE